MAEFSNAEIDFVVWTKGDESNASEGYIWIVRVHKSQRSLPLWEEIVLKLEKFWHNDLAPEIVDPRFDRNMGYRQPDYRLQQIRVKKQKMDRIQETINSAILLKPSLKRELFPPLARD